MAIEVEARFTAAGEEPLRLLRELSRLGPVDFGAPRGSDEVDVYLDDTAGSLSAARWACRLRSRDGRVTLSLKGPPDPASSGWLHRRPEVEGPATAERDPAGWPESAAKTLLERLTGGSPLMERFVLHQHRVERAATMAGNRVGTLTLDTVGVEYAGTTVGRLHVVELELVAGAGDETILGPLAEALTARPGLNPEPRTKLERALELIARA